MYRRILQETIYESFYLAFMLSNRVRVTVKDSEQCYGYTMYMYKISFIFCLKIRVTCRALLCIVPLASFCNLISPFSPIVVLTSFKHSRHGVMGCAL